MNIALHKASERGLSDNHWVKSYHSFSYASYYNPSRMNFGALKALNDEFAEPGQGFGNQPQENMEVIFIPLEGNLEYRDSLGNKSLYGFGDIQILSTGTGVHHSEHNPNHDKQLNFLKLWIQPDQKNVAPRFDQVTIDIGNCHNRFMRVISPDPAAPGMWIYQKAWMHLGKFDQGRTALYKMKLPGNGAYVFVVSGVLTIAGQKLETRDALGITDTSEFEISVLEETILLVTEVPTTAK